MTFSDIASIGSLVSGVAVLISLIYLALQVRQAEKNQRALMNQGTVARVTEMVMGFAQPSLNAISTKIHSGDIDFSAQEVNQLRMMLRMSLLSLQDALVQHRAGLVDSITLETSAGALKAALAMPAYRAIWMRSRSAYAPEMMAFVDDLIAKTPLAAPVDLAAQFKADVAQVMR